MHAGQRVAVVIPAFNARNQIVSTVADIPEFVDDIFIVDDASTDGTAEILAALATPVDLEIIERICCIANKHRKPTLYTRP
jgi:glycosyltransferase involved in cell wall biosynthesis